ncbi:fibronectin type III domain-containing protein 4 isoform X1 [Takifugu flavidus]|uniref:fibronectin type III domain-containing protein 4 isoform X1 n=1 Tax=Takifugu flavidus TaxID=433684 RepID=UPI0025449F59|nr:fibronectin type III domain-containing protein 4 isoform X1 [Takifugu flavidus]
MAENVTQRKEDRKRAEIHKLCSRICGGRDKSKLLPQQSRILHERILGHANAAVTGRCQTENSKRNAIAVHLCGDQARSNSHKDRPPAPVNVSVTHLRSDSATVSWEVPEGDIIIGFSILQQRQEGHTQRFIREVNTTSRSCVLWELEEETDYIIQVQSIGLYGESQASKKVHFRTLKKSDRFPSNSSNQDDPAVQGLDKSRHLQTGEMIIIVVVLVMWAAVIALFCRQYDIIKDNDSSNNKEKAKPMSERSTPEHHSGGGLLRSKYHPSVPSINIIEV